MTSHQSKLSAIPDPSEKRFEFGEDLKFIDFEFAFDGNGALAGGYQYDVSIRPKIDFTAKLFDPAFQNVRRWPILPSELLIRIFGHCTISSLPNLMLANSILYDAVHKVFDFTELASACSQALGALKRNGAGNYFSLDTILHVFRVPDCLECGKPAQYFYIPAKGRLCPECISKRSLYSARKYRFHPTDMLQEIYDLEDVDLDVILRFSHPLIKDGTELSLIEDVLDRVMTKNTERNKKKRYRRTLRRKEDHYKQKLHEEFTIGRGNNKGRPYFYNIPVKQRRERFFKWYDGLEMDYIIDQQPEPPKTEPPQFEFDVDACLMAGAVSMACMPRGSKTVERFLPCYCMLSGFIHFLEEPSPYRAQPQQLETVNAKSMLRLEDDFLKHLKGCRYAQLMQPNSSSWTMYWGHLRNRQPSHVLPFSSPLRNVDEESHASTEYSDSDESSLYSSAHEEGPDASSEEEGEGEGYYDTKYYRVFGSGSNMKFMPLPKGPVSDSDYDSDDDDGSFIDISSAAVIDEIFGYSDDEYEPINRNLSKTIIFQAMAEL